MKFEQRLVMVISVLNSNPVTLQVLTDEQVWGRVDRLLFA